MHCDFIALAAPGVRSLQAYQPGKPDSELRREYGLADIVKLASNENPLGPSPKAVAAVQASVHELARYPDGNGFELKQALAARHDVPLAAITLGNGSNDILELVARAFLTPEHEAVFSEHAFAVYPLATRAVGATARIALANSSGPMPYGHDLEAFSGLINERTRVVFIANPNNPTGTWIPSTVLESFLRSLPDHVVAVVDEAYFEYVEVSDYASALPWIGRFPNLIVTRTFSKAYGLAGLRVGYGVSHPQVADLLNRVRQPFNVSMPALAAAVSALDDDAHLEHSREMNRNGMAMLKQACADLGLWSLPSAANFLCINAGHSGREIFDALLPKGVIIRPVDGYGLPDFLRVTIGTERENRRFLDALQAVLEGL